MQPIRIRCGNFVRIKFHCPSTVALIMCNPHRAHLFLAPHKDESLEKWSIDFNSCSHLVWTWEVSANCLGIGGVEIEPTHNTSVIPPLLNSITGGVQTPQEIIFLATSIEGQPTTHRPPPSQRKVDFCEVLKYHALRLL